MENMTFETWVLSQAHSFLVAMTDALVNSGQVGFPMDFDGVLNDVYREINCTNYTDESAKALVFGNFVVTVNKKARKVGLLNTRSGKFVETYCNKKDKFDVYIGLGVLWAKYNHIKRPVFRIEKKLSELKAHDIFIWSREKYEFIGACANRGEHNKKYIVLRLSNDTISQFYEDTVLVEE